MESGRFSSSVDNYLPDDFYSDSDEGLSDDNEYYEFMEKLKKNQKHFTEECESESVQKKRQLQRIFYGILHERKETVFSEIDDGLYVDTDLESKWTPLLLAATVANIDLISGLVTRGADVNQTREDGATALMLLCNINANDKSRERSILSCVQCLLDNDANVNAVDNRRRTAVMLAAHNGHLDTVKFLLPLVDKEAEDNQRWNVLFWAVDGNSVRVVEFLLSTESFAIEKTDIRGNTVRNLAKCNAVLELFPQDICDECCLHLNNDQLSFEKTFNNLGKSEKPRFFSDVCKMLYGTKSESMMPIFLENNVDLFKFLSLNEAKLKELGVQFPYQRNRIMGGIYKFHKHPFKPQSIPFVRKDELYTNIDVSTAVLTTVKQLIAMEASLKFILENSSKELTPSESKEAQILISKCRLKILRLERVAEQLSKKAERWDRWVKPVDKITKKRRNIPWVNVWLLSAGVVSVTLIILYRTR